MIRFTFEQVICGFLAVGAPSDTWTVATYSLPDEIKYFVQLLWDVFMIKLLLVHRKWTCTNLKILVQCRGHASVHIRTTNVPRYCTIHLPQFPLHSSPLQDFFTLLFFIIFFNVTSTSNFAVTFKKCSVTNLWCSRDNLKNDSWTVTAFITYGTKLLSA